MKLNERTSRMDRAIGAAVKAERQKNGRSQESLAATLGITFQQVQKYEKGTNRIATSTFVLIAQALGVTPVDLFCKALTRYETLGADEPGEATEDAA